MSAIFIAVQCCQCSTMQVKQRKQSSKSNKWTCVVCNQKQSVRQVFAQGPMAKDLRLFVQSSNMSRQQQQQQQQSKADGTPFRTELFTPWMTATLIDFYINVVALSVWVAYKESSWITAVLWIIFLICFGSITTCIYIVRQLLGLASQVPIYLVLLKGGSRAESKCEGVLI